MPPPSRAPISSSSSKLRFGRESSPSPSVISSSGRSFLLRGGPPPPGLPPPLPQLARRRPPLAGSAAADASVAGLRLLAQFRDRLRAPLMQPLRDLRSGVRGNVLRRGLARSRGVACREQVVTLRIGCVLLAGTAA